MKESNIKLITREQNIHLYCGVKAMTTGKCIKPKGHREDKTSRHSDGKYEWGKWW